MTEQTCVMIVRTMRQPATMPDTGRYKCFVIYGPDGYVEYGGGSYRCTLMCAADRFPGLPIVEAYKFRAPIRGLMGGVDGDRDARVSVSRADWDPAYKKATQ